jgi:peptidyl-prolyl cis-trans isomerase C
MTHSTWRPAQTLLRRLIIALSLVIALPAWAQTDDTADEAPTQTLVKVDGFPITNVHFAVFASQTGRNPSDAAGQISLLNELVNHFMVANSPAGQALAGDPDVVAALEVAKARLIAQTFVRAQLEATPVTEADIQAAYDAKYAASDGKEYKARHILLDDEQAARDVIAELDKGADFAELAGSRSTGPSKTVGGDLGWFEPSQMVAPFAAATAALEDDSYSKEPVRTDFGWHVILREDSRDVSPPDLASVRDELTREIQQQRVGAAITQIREKSDIEVQSLE